MPQPPNINKMLEQAQKLHADSWSPDQLKEREDRGQRRRRLGQDRDHRRAAARALAIDPDVVDPEDVEMLQDLVPAAVNEAIRKGRRAPAEPLSAAPSRAASTRWSALESLGLGGIGGVAAAVAALPAGCQPAAACGAPTARARRAARRARGGGGAGGTCPRPKPLRCCPAPSAARHRAFQAPGHRRPHRPAARVPPASAPRSRTPCALADAIREVKERIALCETRFDLAEGPRCAICLDARRDPATLRVVEEPSDVIPIERTREFRGRYHVLGGALTPIDGIEPEDLRSPSSSARDDTVREVVLATNPTTTGEATALYIAAALHDRGPTSRSPAWLPASPSARTSSTRTRSLSATRSPAAAAL